MFFFTKSCICKDFTTRATSPCPPGIQSHLRRRTKLNQETPRNGDSTFMWRTSIRRGFHTSEIFIIFMHLSYGIYNFFFRIVSNKYPISALEWDVFGKHLLVCDISGHCQIWSQRDNLLSDWHQLYESHFAGEHIVQAAFFHNGMKMSLVDKKDVTNYIDKFQRIKFTPSVVQFGQDQKCCVYSIFNRLLLFIEVFRLRAYLW